MSFVVDCSVAMAWCFADEATGATETLLRRLHRESAHAPSLWPLEVLNVLATAERHGRITPAESRERHRFLRSLPVILDKETAEQAWTASSDLSRRFGLTVYDAAYLELAQRMNLPLATLDMDLRKAAKKTGVPLLGK